MSTIACAHLNLSTARYLLLVGKPAVEETMYKKIIVPIEMGTVEEGERAFPQGGQDAALMPAVR